MDLKSIQVEVNIPTDTGNISKMMLVFDAEKPTEVFNALKQATHDIERAFMQNGIITKHGVGVHEMKDYLEYMKDVVEAKENRIKELYIMRDLMVDEKYQAVIDEQLEECWLVVDEYYEMFEEVQVVTDVEESQ